MRNMAKLDLSLVLACYRESEIFDDSVRRIREVLDTSRFSYEIIFVEDKSPDNTAKLIQRVVKGSKNLKAIYHEHNKGRGRTVTDGIMAAQGEVVGFIDIDLEVSPVYIPEIVNIILNKKADMVIGKRIYRSSISSMVREILSRGYVSLASQIIDTGKVDSEAGYKFFNRRKIIPVVKKTKHPHWFWDTEITVRAKMAGLKIVEVPVLFLRRSDKTSTVKVFKDSWDYLVSLWNFKRDLSKE
jgi:glycosyltransferase AglD